MQYRGSLGSYVQSTWLFASASGSTEACWDSSWASADDEEHDESEEEDDDEDDWWFEFLMLFLEIIRVQG